MVALNEAKARSREMVVFIACTPRVKLETFGPSGFGTQRRTDVFRATNAGGWINGLLPLFPKRKRLLKQSAAWP
jgi:hypothetical protein